MGPNVQTWPISLGSEMQSSTSGQFSFGGSGLSTTGSMRVRRLPLERGDWSRAFLREAAADHRSDERHLGKRGRRHLEQIATEESQIGIEPGADHSAPP